MNLFWLHAEPGQAAQLNSDSHLVATIREGALMIHAALANHVPEEEAPDDWYNVWNPQNLNNPLAEWMAHSRRNFVKGFQMVRALNREYVIRDRKQEPNRENHGSWNRTYPLWKWRNRIPKGELTPPPQLMPEEYQSDDPWMYVGAYRRYYRNEKAYFDGKGEWATWSSPRSVPKFMRVAVRR